MSRWFGPSGAPYVNPRCAGLRHVDRTWFETRVAPELREAYKMVPCLCAKFYEYCAFGQDAVALKPREGSK